MSTRHFLSAAALLSVFMLPRTALAQGNPIELGIDASFSMKVNDPNATVIQLPTGPVGNLLLTGANKSFRVGIFVSPTVSIEPAVSFFLIDPEGGGGSDRLLGIGLGALFHFYGNQNSTQAYVRPYVGFDSFKFSGGSSETQFSAGGGVGVKLPVANQLKARLELAYVHGFENTTDLIPAQDVIALLFGFSFLTN